MLDKLKVNIHIKKFPQSQRSSTKKEFFSSSNPIHSSEHHNKIQMAPFCKITRFKNTKNDFNSVHRTFEVQEQLRASKLKSTRFHTEMFQRPSSKIKQISINYQKGFGRESTKYPEFFSRKNKNQLLYTIKQSRKKKEKYMKIEGLSAGKMVIDLKERMKSLKRRNISNASTTLSKKVKTEESGQKKQRTKMQEQNQLFTRFECRPWSSKKLAQQNIIFF